MDSQAEFLGPLLVEENLLVPEQLELALKFAQSTGLPLDQIVVAEFAVPQPDISRLLAQVNGDATEEADDEPAVIVPPARPLGFRIRRPIGQIFVDLGFITTEDREAALEVQRESGALLGEILVEQGKLTRLELANALSEHWDSYTGDDGRPPEHKPSLTVVPASKEDPSTPDAPDVAELRRSLGELAAARVADAQAAEARIAAIDEALVALAPRDDDEFRQATTARLQELASKVEAAESGSTGAADLDARLDELAGSTLELRSELEALASRPAEAEPSKRVKDLQQTIEALAQTMNDRLTTLAAELRAENATRTDEIATQLRAQTEELAASLAGSRVDDFDESRQADADAARVANDKLHERLDALIALRASDLEATHAAQAHAAAEAARIEQALRSELEALASLQVESERGESVGELKQAIDALAQTTDERLVTLGTELRAEAGELTASFGALRETVAGSLAETKQSADAWADESRTLTARVNDLGLSRHADADAAELANSQLHQRLDELIAFRAADTEATQAAQAQATHAAAETARIEHALRAELEVLASLQVDHGPDERVDGLTQKIDALTRRIDDQLETITTELRAESASRTDDISAQLQAHTEQVENARAADANAVKSANGHLRERLDELVALRTTDIEATQAAQAHAAAESARIEQALRSELETLASLQAETEPDERVNELTQTIDALAQSIDDRLASLAAALQAETVTRSDDIAAQLRAQAETVEASRGADTKAVKVANGQLRERLDELVALRVTDIEATQAAQAQATHAAAETARIEQALRSELETLAVSRAEADTDELKQTIDTLAQSIDDRLEAITAELRAEAATRTDDIAAQLHAQTEKIESSRAADAKAVKSAGGQIHRRLDELIALRATDLEATQAAQAQATHAAAEAVRIEQALRSELETLASLQDEVEPDDSVNELRQTIDALAQTTDERLATLATELQAETATRTDDISAQLRAQTDELTASIAALRETVAGTHAENKHNADAWADESRTLTARVNDVDVSRRADAEAAELANDQIHQRLDELIALRTTDLEATQAAQARAAAEAARIEHGLVGALGDLAVQLDDLRNQLGRSVPDNQPLPVDHEPIADHSETREPKPGKKRSKQGKSKKKPKH